MEPGNAQGRARQSEVAVAPASLACDRPGVVDMFGGSVLAVAVSSDCKKSGLLFEGLNSVVKLLGGRGAFVLVSSDWWHRIGRC